MSEDSEISEPDCSGRVILEFNMASVVWIARLCKRIYTCPPRATQLTTKQSPLRHLIIIKIFSSWRCAFSTYLYHHFVSKLAISWLQSENVKFTSKLARDRHDTNKKPVAGIYCLTFLLHSIHHLSLRKRLPKRQQPIVKSSQIYIRNLTVETQLYPATRRSKKTVTVGFISSRQRRTLLDSFVFMRHHTFQPSLCSYLTSLPPSVGM